MLKGVGRLLGALFRRRRFEREMTAEMSHHLELEIEDRVARGMTPEEARRTALRDFGGVERWKEEARAARGLGGWDALRQDLRYGWRTLTGSPGFTAVAVATLAVGIGATTAVFSVVDGLLLRPLDFHEPDRIVRLLSYELDDPSDRGTISGPNFRDWLTESGSLRIGALYDEYRPTLRTGDAAMKVEAASVGARYFDVLGVEPLLGRFFRPEEDEGGALRVVLSEGLWREAFGGDSSVLGESISLSGTSYTVVGVAPGMENPHLSYSVSDSPRLWRVTPQYFLSNGRGGRSFTGIARLAPGVTLAEARSELASIQAGLIEQYPEANAGQRVRAVPLKEDMVGDTGPVLWVLFGAVGLVLLIACANVANLLLFRAAGRGREIGLRAALGASRGRIARQLMVESGLLAALGAAGGVVVALGATRLLTTLAAGQLPRIEAVGLDLRVLGFTMVIGAGAALLFGLVPALHTVRTDVRSALAAGGGRGTAAQGGRQARLRPAIVTIEVALAVVVVLGAGLLGRSLLRLQAVDPGMEAQRVAVLRADPPAERYNPWADDGDAATFDLYRRMLDRARAVPGVDAAAITDLLPMSGNFDGNGFRIEGRPEPAPGEWPSAEARSVLPGYFRTMGIPLHEGRGVLASDDADAERVVVVNRAFQRRHFPDGDAIGAGLVVFSDDAPPARIVGVVGDVTQFSLDDVPQPVMYIPMPQAPNWKQDEPWVVVRTAGDAAAVLPGVLDALRELEPAMPLYDAATMDAVVSRTLARPRFRTMLLLAFAAIAFLLAVIGVYGMVAYTVARRLPELGVRMALGADAGRIRRMVVSQGLRPVLAGTAIGLAAGLLAAGLIRGLLFGVSATDPVILAGAPAVLILVAVIAAWLPARRAARMAPGSVLKAE